MAAPWRTNPCWFCLASGIAILLWSAAGARADQQRAATIFHNTSLRIDCGGPRTFVNEFKEKWLSDRFYTGGSTAALVSTSDHLRRSHEWSLRYFPPSTGKKNCYIVELPNGRYSIRMFFVYGNYDRKSRPPNFDVSVEGTVVFSWRYPWSDEEAKNGVYSDLYTFIDDGDAKICFYSIATDSPVIGALEIVSVDPQSYSSLATGTDVILVNYGRFTGGLKAFGAGVSREGDKLGRAWEPDATLATTFGESFYLRTDDPIKNAEVAPNYFPQRLYQSAHTLTSPGSIEFMFTVDTSLDYMLWFHFAEIDTAVTASGQRVFDVFINSEAAFSEVDVYKEAGSFAAYDLFHVLKNLTGSALNVTLSPRVGTPILNGLENYAILPMDLSTSVDEVLAMLALKESLRVPERMGWNGDPCAPFNWDTWEGVTCNYAPDGKSLVITRLDLSGQGLKGTINDKITSLKHLRYLNMSNNNLRGSIPSGLGNDNLETVDLSSNDLTGSIPESLGQAQLVKVLLNNNELNGQVPLTLYTIGVRGGFFNISSNDDLCGVPALPDCPFWQRQELSTPAKIGIALTALAGAAALSTLIYIFVIRRRRDDYNFGLPHQLASRSARYQRHKSKLRLEDSSAPVSKFGFAANMNTL
ncbi:receptor-like protein 4 [Selaginella moellendorffii]|uniref:receptor-like protein 4 n=1 Tax=Selaginella moellendorffii TaxID=88036 RepID=UPI000D1D0318|nr:receptor-like protein 4 [Selaginella moellendorffii]|eukprot:XP_002991178.2 receptor-like protein 4 [Selaginella moellendorffii]